MGRFIAIRRVLGTVFIFAIISWHEKAAKPVEASLDIGVNYGMLGDNLPPPSDVIELFKKHNIGKIRFFDPVPAALQALRGSGISVTIGVHNQDLPGIASSVVVAKLWFDTYVQPYLTDVEIMYIAVGNEVIPGEFDRFVLPAMENFQEVINGYGYRGMRVTTVIATSTLGVSYPPSAGAFEESASATLGGILGFLSATSSPLLLNVYPYFAYASDPEHISLDYALFTATTPVIHDQGLSYWNMLDAQVDAVYSAMEKLGLREIDIVISETGWPSAGNGIYTTPELAGTYNRNFMKKMLAMQGTPKRPDHYLEGFIFAMFNENLKPAGVEQNFGLFYPNSTPVYPVFS